MLQNIDNALEKAVKQLEDRLDNIKTIQTSTETSEVGGIISILMSYKSQVLAWEREREGQ